MARLNYSQRLLALFQETSWVVVFRWICETLRSFLQAWKANLMSKACSACRGSSFKHRVPVYSFTMRTVVTWAGILALAWPADLHGK